MRQPPDQEESADSTRRPGELFVSPVWPYVTNSANEPRNAHLQVLREPVTEFVGSFHLSAPLCLRGQRRRGH